MRNPAARRLAILSAAAMLLGWSVGLFNPRPAQQAAARTLAAPTATATPSCALRALDMVAWWRGESDAADTLGQHNGTLLGGATFAAGKVGSAFSLDGVNDYVTIPDAAALTPPSNSISVDAWIRPDDITLKHTIITKYQSSSGDISWSLTVEAGGQVRFGIYQSTQTLRAVDTYNRVIKAGVWQHVAGTFDLDTQETRIYVDGALLGVYFVPGHNATITSIKDSASPVRIGTFVNTGGSLINFWDGAIDEVSLYDRALSKAEVFELYKAGAKGRCYPFPTPTPTRPPTATRAPTLTATPGPDLDVQVLLPLIT